MIIIITTAIVNRQIINNCTGIFFKVLCIFVNESVQTVTQWFAFSKHVEQIPQVQQLDGRHEQTAVLTEKPLGFLHGEFFHRQRFSSDPLLVLRHVTTVFAPHHRHESNNNNKKRLVKKRCKTKLNGYFFFFICLYHHNNTTQQII